MLDISEELKELLLLDSTKKELIIRFDEDERLGEHQRKDMTAEDIIQESMKLEEKLCSDMTLKIGSCEASSFFVTTTLVDVTMVGTVIRPFLKIYGEEEKTYELPLGVFKIKDCKLADNRGSMDITAYDVMADLLAMNVAEWYESLWVNHRGGYTLKQFRDSYFNYVGVEQVDTELLNDGMEILETIAPNGQLSGQKVLNAICEINGVFGHINREGKFTYIDLTKMISAIYPSDGLFPSDNLYPSDNQGMIFPTTYNIKTIYADYDCRPIDKVVVRQEEGDVGGSYPEIIAINNYVIEDNFLAYGHSDLNNIAKNIYEAVSDITYTPCTHECKGFPALEVGDCIGVAMKTRGILETIVLQRTLTGIQALRDTYKAEGTEFYPTKATSMSQTIYQLQKQVNILTRELGLLRSEIYKEVRTIGEDNEENVYRIGSKIEQTADHITLAVSESGTYGDWYIGTNKVKYTTNNINTWKASFPYSTAEIGDNVLDTSTGLLWHIITMRKDNHTRELLRHYDVDVIKDAETPNTAYKPFDVVLDTTITGGGAYVYQVQSVGKNYVDFGSPIARCDYYVSNIDNFRPDYSILAENQTVVDNKGDIYKISNITKNSYQIGNTIQLQRVSTRTSSEITQKAGEISASVVKVETDRATGAEATLSSRITANASAIALRVTKDGVLGDINAKTSGIKIEANKITLDSTGNLIIKAGNFKLDDKGNAELTGKITSTSGSIGGWELNGTTGIKRTATDAWGNVTTSLTHGGLAFSSTKCDTKYKDDGIQIGTLNRGESITYSYLDGDHLQIGNSIIANKSSPYTTTISPDATIDSSNATRTTRTANIGYTNSSGGTGTLRFVNGLLVTAN